MGLKLLLYRSSVVLAFIFLLFTFMHSDDVHGQSAGSSDDYPTSESYKNHNTILPAIGATPETGFLFGGVFMRQFKPGGAGTDTRSSVLLFSGIYTLKNQLILSVAPLLILKDESWIFEGNFLYQLFPDSYWGIGNGTKDSDEVIFEYKQWGFFQSALKKISNDMFAGPVLKWVRTTELEFMDLDDHTIPHPDVNGSRGSTSAGFGGIYMWDARNSMMTPSRNHLISFSAVIYPGLLGTTFPYIAGELDARKYFDLSGKGKTVLAFHYNSMFTSGNPAFTDYPSLGGDRILRGYYYGRYRDHNTVQVQAEFRQHLFRRLGFTFFASSGEAWSSINELNVADLKYSAGGGLRFNLNKDDTTNLRIDYGVGKGTHGFYLTFGEAF